MEGFSSTQPWSSDSVEGGETVPLLAAISLARFSPCPSLVDFSECGRSTPFILPWLSFTSSSAQLLASAARLSLHTRSGTPTAARSRLCTARMVSAISDCACERCSAAHGTIRIAATAMGIITDIAICLCDISSKKYYDIPNKWYDRIFFSLFQQQ